MIGIIISVVVVIMLLLIVLAFASAVPASGAASGAENLASRFGQSVMVSYPNFMYHGQSPVGSGDCPVHEGHTCRFDTYKDGERARAITLCANSPACTGFFETPGKIWLANMPGADQTDLDQFTVYRSQGNSVQINPGQYIHSAPSVPCYLSGDNSCEVADVAAANTLYKKYVPKGTLHDLIGKKSDDGENEFLIVPIDGKIKLTGTSAYKFWPKK